MLPGRTRQSQSMVRLLSSSPVLVASQVTECNSLLLKEPELASGLLDLALGQLPLNSWIKEGRKGHLDCSLACTLCAGDNIESKASRLWLQTREWR